MIGFDHPRIIRLFMMAALIPLAGGCVTSQHWDETMNDPAQQFEIESEIRTPEQREYWEKIRGNYGAWIFPILLEDSIDKERNSGK